MEVGDDVALVVPDEAAARALGDGGHVEREDIALHGEARDEHDRGRSVAEDLDVALLVAAQLWRDGRERLLDWRGGVVHARDGARARASDEVASGEHDREEGQEREELLCVLHAKYARGARPLLFLPLHSPT